MRCVRFGVLLGAALLACTSSTTTKPKAGGGGITDGERPKPPSADEEKDAKALADSGDKDGVLAKYPGTAAAADIYAQRARDAQAAGKSDEAVANFEKLFFYRPTYDGIEQMREPYARALLDIGRYSDAATMLQPLIRKGDNSPDQQRLQAMLGEAMRGGGQGKQAVELYVSQRKSGAVDRATAERNALDTVDGNLSLRDAEGLWKDHGSDADYDFLQAALAFKLAKFYFHVRDYEHAGEMANLVTSKFASSAYAAPAQQLIDRLKQRQKVDPKVIGAVLPMSGRLQQFGERSAKALEMVLTPAGYKVVVKDSKGDPLEAARAVESLVLKDNAIAIVGDIASTSALAAAQKAEEMGVPIISLAHGEAVPEVGPYTFRAALTNEAQAKALAHVAMDQMGMTRFALMYPRTANGVGFATAFWREVEAKHGEIRGAQPYDHGQTTFSEQASKIVGRYYKGTRGDMYKAVQELKEQGYTGPRLQSAIEKAEKNLPPIVDFDALVIPDTAQNLSLIIPAVAYEDVQMDHDQRRLERRRKATGDRNLKPITLMGGSTWNTPQLLEKCEPQYCDQAIFVDGFFADSTDARVRDFVSNFKAQVGGAPGLSDAEAYDVGGLLKQVLAGGQITDRDGLRRTLETFQGYPGVTGVLKFDSIGETERDPVVLTIDESQIKQWSAPKPNG
jgi:branched-chain amino acid transport system substrate-binding protein